jgi:hypothetical protein
VERLNEALNWVSKGGPRPGYYDDGCPSTFMHPVILDDFCVANHFSDYSKEMFNRCKPW